MYTHNPLIMNFSLNQPAVLDLKSYLDKGLTYTQYLQLTEKLIVKGKTTGDDQTIHRINFTKLNAERMKRIDKTALLSIDMINLLSKVKPVTWLVIAEAWCGDCAQILPYLNKMAIESGGRIKLVVTLRDENQELMNVFLTNGTRSVPKLIMLDPETNEVINTWGPRPLPAAKIASHWKANSILIPWNDFEKELHLWYSKDKGISVIAEVSALLRT